MASTCKSHLHLHQNLQILSLLLGCTALTYSVLAPQSVQAQPTPQITGPVPTVANGQLVLEPIDPAAIDEFMAEQATFSPVSVPATATTAPAALPIADASDLPPAIPAIPFVTNAPSVAIDPALSSQPALSQPSLAPLDQAAIDKAVQEAKAQLKAQLNQANSQIDRTKAQSQQAQQAAQQAAQQNAQQVQQAAQQTSQQIQQAAGEMGQAADEVGQTAQQAAAALDLPPKLGSSITVSPLVGTTGVGVSVSSPFNNQMRVRADISGFSWNANGDIGNIDYDARLKMLNLGGMVDYYPSGPDSIFHVSTGLYLQNNRIEGSARPTNGNPLTIGNNSYSTSDLDKIDASIHYSRPIAPYLGIGIGAPINGKKGGLSVFANIGMMFTGKPEVELDVSGVNGAIGNQLNGDLDREAKKAEQEVRNRIPGILPVVNFGASYRF